jgi:hypothetical protein
MAKKLPKPKSITPPPKKRIPAINPNEVEPKMKMGNLMPRKKKSDT